jgi:hypothetical protein
MRQFYLLVIMLAIVGASCGHKNFTTTSSENTTDTIVKDTTSVVNNSKTDSAAQQSVEIDNNQANTFSIVGTASYKNKYCGGARPTPEIEKHYNNQYPLPSCKIKFANSNNNSVVYATTDAQGNFHTSLCVGTWTYWLISTPESSLPIDISCQKYFDHNYGSFEIANTANTNIQILFSFPCNPCDPYSNQRP